MSQNNEKSKDEQIAKDEEYARQLQRQFDNETFGIPIINPNFNLPSNQQNVQNLQNPQIPQNFPSQNQNNNPPTQPSRQFNSTTISQDGRPLITFTYSNRFSQVGQNPPSRPQNSPPQFVSAQSQFSSSHSQSPPTQTYTTHSRNLPQGFNDLFNRFFNPAFEQNFNFSSSSQSRPSPNQNFSIPNFNFPTEDFTQIFTYFRQMAEQQGSQMHPASEQEINDLPSFTVGEMELTEKEKEQTCCFCMEKFAEKEKVRKLPCKHIFHLKEIDQWLKINKVCPVCKTPIDGRERT